MAAEKEDAVVARIDERTISIQNEISRMSHDLKSNLLVIDGRFKEQEQRHNVAISEVKESISDLDANMEANFVKKSEFTLVQKVVYGFVSLILVSVVAALIATVVIQPKGSVGALSPEKTMVVK